MILGNKSEKPGKSEEINKKQFHYLNARVVSVGKNHAV